MNIMYDILQLSNFECAIILKTYFRSVIREACFIGVDSRITVSSNASNKIGTNNASSRYMPCGL